MAKKKKMKVVYTPEFWKSWDRLFNWRYAPLRWWNSFLRTPRELRHYWERITKGYSYQDVWSLDYHIARVIVGGLADLKKISDGVPGPFTVDKAGKELPIKEARANYDATLQEIIDGYQAWIDDDGWVTKPEVKKKFRRAQILFNKYFGCFWW